MPFVPEVAWPRISVVVCSYNGSRTIRDTCEGLQNLEYPNFEVIVVDDGSTDDTASIAIEAGFRVISTVNRGLSSARNTGMEAATGEIVAYIDDDAYPDPQWLTYIAATFLKAERGSLAGVGGPNIAPPDDGQIADCVTRSPGGPAHVLLSDQTAEHIPGCNMAFLKSCLQAIGGFDPQFRVAGDDVDICWRLQKHGWALGFSPAAVVWHHRRNSVRNYFRQQKGYGKAEAMLERKWPDKYNAAGHLVWSGRIYGACATYLGWRAGRIYHGTWGLAPYQSLYEPAPNLLESLPMMPEWYLIVGVLAIFSFLGSLWTPMRFALPLLALAAGAPFVLAARHALQVALPAGRAGRVGRLRRTFLRLTVAYLHLIQPLARLWGRMRHGLTPWRRKTARGLALPRPFLANIWSGRTLEVNERLRSFESTLRARGGAVRRGGDYDRWDLEVVGGLLGSARMCMAVEHHGDGRQLLRIRSWPRISAAGAGLTLLFAGLTAQAVLDGARTAGAVLGLMTAFLVSRAFRECASGTAGFLAAVRHLESEESTGDDRH